MSTPACRQGRRLRGDRCQQKGRDQIDQLAGEEPVVAVRCGLSPATEFHRREPDGGEPSMQTGGVLLQEWTHQRPPPVDGGRHVEWGVRVEGPRRSIEQLGGDAQILRSTVAVGQFGGRRENQCCAQLGDVIMRPRLIGVEHLVSLPVHLSIVLADDRPYDAVPVAEVILQGDRVAGARGPVDLTQTHPVDPPRREEFLGGGHQSVLGRFGVASQWTTSWVNRYGGNSIDNAIALDHRGGRVAWDFSTEPEFQEQLDWVDQFCREEIEPLELVFPFAVRMRDPKMKALVDPLKAQVKERGLWAIFLDKELGGPGFGQLKLALVNEILGRYGTAPSIFGCQAPDTGNMEILAAYGTEVQKERWLTPLINQEIWSAYSMTEPQGGSDPNLFKTTAVRDGDEWVINGEKWFTSAGRYADIIFVMCTNGIFIVPKDAPGVEIKDVPRTHDHIIYNEVRVPLDHLLGPEDGGKVLAQRRLGGGRIHHAMRAIAQCTRAFDMMCERALSRESHGKVIAEHQMVQSAIAESYAEINMLRLLVLWTAWTIDNSSTQESRTQIAACKYTAAKVLREVSYRAIHILGSLGVTDLTPLQAMWAGSPAMSVMDGVDEVHQVTVARNVLKSYRPHEGVWPTDYFPTKRAAARVKFADAMAEDPDLVKYADFMARRSGGH
jgi:acyl-CoA dehydrogenase